MTANEVATIRPRTLVLVAGTGTEVGKTWCGAALARALRDHGRSVAARKPAQSFEPDDPTTDADELAAATGEDSFAVCPAHRRYEVAMAPMMAAEVLGRPPFTTADLVGEVCWPEPPVDVGLLEMAGGVRSPIAADGGDSVTIATLVRPDLVLLVADAGLGTINAIRLCGDALAGWPLVVLLNRFDEHVDLHRRNRDWLVAEGWDVITDVEPLADRLRESDKALNSIARGAEEDSGDASANPPGSGAGEW